LSREETWGGASTVLSTDVDTPALPTTTPEIPYRDC
jgi:hypothetical protein